MHNWRTGDWSWGSGDVCPESVRTSKGRTVPAPWFKWTKGEWRCLLCNNKHATYDHVQSLPHIKRRALDNPDAWTDWWGQEIGAHIVEVIPHAAYGGADAQQHGGAAAAATGQLAGGDGASAVHAARAAAAASRISSQLDAMTNELSDANKKLDACVTALNALRSTIVGQLGNNLIVLIAAAPGAVAANASASAGGAACAAASAENQLRPACSMAPSTLARGPPMPTAANAAQPPAQAAEESADEREPATTEEPTPAAAEGAAAAKEPAAPGMPAAAEAAAAAEEPAAAGEPAAAKEPAATEEPAAAKEPAALVGAAAWAEQGGCWAAFGRATSNLLAWPTGRRPTWFQKERASEREGCRLPVGPPPEANVGRGVWGV